MAKAKRETLVRYRNKVYRIDNLKRWKEHPIAYNLQHVATPVYTWFGDEWFRVVSGSSTQYSAETQVTDSDAVRALNAIARVSEE